MAADDNTPDDAPDTRTDHERLLDELPEGLAFAVALRDVARATVAHNPVAPAAPAWRALLRVCLRIAPDAPEEPQPAAVPRRVR